MPHTVTSIPLSKLVESPFNPRKNYDDEKLKELAASLKVGQQVPIKVRETDGDKYEIVFGHRRYRAAKLGKLDALDAQVVKMSDDAALLAQIVENGQREDVTPLEEADSYRTMQEKFNKSVDEIAATIGKSKSHVYARIKLAALKDAGRKALMAGKILPETALLVARIPTEKLQAKATKEIVEQGLDTFRVAAEHIQRNYMLQLADAPFSKTREDYLTEDEYQKFGQDGAPTGQSCKECAYRTGNIPQELRADVKGADICTQPDCFRAKIAAHSEEEMAALKEQGAHILPASEQKGLFVNGGRNVDPQSGYVDVDVPYANDPKRRDLRTILSKDLPEVAVARDPDGRVRYLAEQSAIAKALKDVGFGKPSPAEEKANEADKEAARKEREQKALRKQTAVNMLDACGEIGVKPLVLLRLVAREMPWAVVEEVAKTCYDTDAGGWKKLVEGAKEDQLQTMLLQCVVQSNLPAYIRGDSDKGLKEVLSEMGVNLRDEEKATKQAMKEEEEAIAAAKEEAKQAAKEEKKPAKAKGPLARKMRKGA